MKVIGPNMAEALETLYKFEMQGVNELQTEEINQKCFRTINCNTLKRLQSRNLVYNSKIKRSFKPFDSITHEPIPFNEETGKFETDNWPNPIYPIYPKKYYWKITSEGMNYVESDIRKEKLKILSSKIKMDQFVEGIAFNKDQPFGIELEFTTPDFTPILSEERDMMWLSKANRIGLAIQRVTGKPPIISKEYIKSDISNWTVKYDDSCGWEVTSPKLMGKDDLIECLSVVDSIKGEIERGLGVIVNQNTGFHLHLELKIKKVDDLINLIKYIRYYEPSFYSLIPPSRLNNKYCKSFREGFPKKYLRQIKSIKGFRELFYKIKELDHYISVNFERYAGPDRSTIEIRLHSGTYDWDKVLHWISLWMGIIRNGRYFVKNNVKDEIFYPDFSKCGDILQIANEVKLLDNNIAWLEKRRYRQMRNWHSQGFLSDNEFKRGMGLWYKHLT